jgi:hypothetical protein
MGVSSFLFLSLKISMLSGFHFLSCWFETVFCYVTQAGLELTILLLQPPKCWDYRPPFHVEKVLYLFIYLFVLVLGFELRAHTLSHTTRPFL